MILKEMDPLLAREEFMIILQEILTNVEHGNIPIKDAIEQIKLVEQDINVMASLSITSRQDAFEWNYLDFTIQNMLRGLSDDLNQLKGK